MRQGVETHLETRWSCVRPVRGAGGSSVRQAYRYTGKRSHKQSSVADTDFMSGCMCNSNDGLRLGCVLQARQQGRREPSGGIVTYADKRP